MTYCRQGHTLVDNEAEGLWEQLVPGTNFELLVNAVTFFGVVDEYAPPTPTTLVCRLFSDSNRTILVTTPITTGVPYEISNFVDYKWKKQDLQGRIEGDIGLWESPPVLVRDDTGIWVGNWIVEPKTEEENSEVEFKFEGTHVLFKATVDAPLISEQAGVGLVAGDYQYCIVPVDGSGRLGAGSRTLNITLAGTADIFIDWLPNNQVSQWNIYGRQAGGSFGLQATLPGSTVSYVDNGTDAPNPAFQPPLFEDPAWTVAVANKTVAIADSGIDSTGDISEDGNQLSATGQASADASDVGGFVLDNTVAGLIFDISNLESTIQVTENVSLDPNLFINSPLPPDQQTYVVRYDYHVFVNDIGLTVVEETDDQTGQTKRLTFDTVAETITVEIIENAIIISTSVLVLDPTTVIPAPGSMSSTITYDNVRILANGDLIGRESIEANTYQVAPQIIPGIMFLTSQNFGNTVNGQVAFTVDGAQTWNNYNVPGTRLVTPPGFGLGTKKFLRAHGEGWTVIGAINNTVVPSLVSDYSMHWTNDLSAVPWPFNDAQGRVASGSITVAQFNNINRFLSTRNVTFTIRKFANGLGPVMSKDNDTDELPKSFGDTEIDFFFPTTGTFVFQNPGATLYRHTTFWKEKNLLIGVENGAIANIFTNPITTNPAAPLGPQTFQHLISPVPSDILAMGTSRDMAYIVWKRVVTSELGWSFSFDGVTWTDVVINNTNDADYRNPGNEVIGLYPGDHSDPQRNGDLMWYRDTTQLAISVDDGNTWTNTPAKAGGALNNWEFEAFESGVFGEITNLKTPMFWDGINFCIDNPVTGLFPGGQFYRMKPDFSDDAPNIGGTFNIGGSDTTDVSWSIGTTIGSAGSPNGIPAANLRRYIGRSVIIPVGVAQPNAPFSIRDTSKSAVYKGRNTNKYQTDIGLLDIVIQTIERGGLGNTTFTRIDEGQQIMRSVPSNLPASALAVWKDPPVNMRWTSAF